jgi:magnesium-transporting ATPase (P-type)
MESFRSAGIHVWVLTGDKMETSVNVAFNAGVIEQGTTIIAIEKIDHRLIGQ